MEIKPFIAIQPSYSPREFAALYRAYVAPMSYVTVLSQIELYRNSGGKLGIYADQTPGGQYRIPAAWAEEVIQAALAARKGR